MDAVAVLPCAHCGTSVRGAAGPADEVFCCAGCRTAASVIRACGLGDFHALRAAFGSVAPVAAADEPPQDDAAYVGQVVARADGLAAFAWHVEGVRCAACVWLLERMPWLDPGVRSARVDLATARLAVVYDPTATSPARQAALARTLGYRLRPYADDAAAISRSSERRALLLRFAIALGSSFASMHLALNVTAGDLAGDMDARTRLFFAVASCVAALPAVTWSAAPFWRGAAASIVALRWTLDATVAVILAASLVGGVAAAAAGGPLYLDAAAMFVCLLLAGRVALALALDRAARAGAALGGILPRAARRLSSDGECIVRSDALVVGDRVRVAAGEAAPCDGVAEGSGWIDCSVLTGEPRAIAVAPGDAVIGGARVRGELVLRATAVGGRMRVATLLARARLAAQSSRPSHRAVDALQAAFAPAVLGLATIAAVMHLGEGARVAWSAALAMVLVCCPCALGLAGPLVRAVTIGRAARRGLLLRDVDALERLRRVRHVVLDKTGTLTAGRMTVGGWHWLRPLSQDERDFIAGAVRAAEERSRHPVAAAIVADVDARGVRAVPIHAWSEAAGAGVSCATGRGPLRVGAPAWIGVDGDGPVVEFGGEPIARLPVEDPLVPNAAELVARLRSLGLRPRILSGDAPARVAVVAAEVGIAPAHARGSCSPEGKARILSELSADGGVAMIGDGINDALALAAADVGIGVRGGIEPSLGCCTAFVGVGGLAGAVDLVAAAHGARRAEAACLALSVLYNIAGVAAVAAGIAGPLVCAAAMPLSSASVVLLAWWLSPFAATRTSASSSFA